MCANRLNSQKGIFPNSIFIGLDGSFAPWVGELIVDIKQPILLLCPDGREEEAVTRLARVGFDQTIGVLDGGIASWKAAGKAIDQVHSITAETFANNLSSDKKPIFDVRKNWEFGAEHVENAVHTPLSQVNEYLAEYPTDGPFYMYCAGGYRSIIAASILKSRGIHNMIDVQGGFKAIKKTSITTTDFICQQKSSNRLIC